MICENCRYNVHYKDERVKYRAISTSMVENRFYQFGEDVYRKQRTDNYP